MTITTKSKEVNGNYIEITQEKFSNGYKVALYDSFGHVDLFNYYGDEKKANSCFYRYCKLAKTR